MWQKIPLTPKRLACGMRWWPPYWGAGIRTDYISDDWRSAQVSMNLRWFNRNAVGTHFGGSLYSMVDPHIMLMLMRILGKNYLIWDKAAHIEFISPGKGRVVAQFQITDDDVARIYEHTATGEKYLPEFIVNILHTDGSLVARVTKTLYIRRKKPIG